MMKTPLTVVILFCSFTLLAEAADTPPDARLAQIFKNFDRDGDGGISLEEYKAGMVGNMAPERVENVFLEKDRNHDGQLDVQELIYVPQDQRAPATPAPRKDEPKRKQESATARTDSPADARLVQTFKNFDTNHDGGISFDEYQVGMSANMSEGRIVKVFAEKDLNHDGKLNLDELLYIPLDQRTPAPLREVAPRKSKK